MGRAERVSSTERDAGPRGWAVESCSACAPRARERDRPLAIIFAFGSNEQYRVGFVLLFFRSKVSEFSSQFLKGLSLLKFEPT
jgi:hypothetical protein